MVAYRLPSNEFPTPKDSIKLEAAFPGSLCLKIMSISNSDYKLRYDCRGFGNCIMFNSSESGNSFVTLVDFL